MKKSLAIIILSIVLSGNAYAIPQDGKGELKLTYKVVQRFQAYLRGGVSEGKAALKNKPMVFYVTSDGTGSYWWYCSHGACASGNSIEEVRMCERHYNKECFRFARKTSVRWKNGINPAKGKQSKFNAKMSNAEILAKLTELGFYGNSDSSTTTTKPKITKQLKDLKDLLDSGVLTQEEFASAKKKLLK